MLCDKVFSLTMVDILSNFSSFDCNRKRFFICCVLLHRMNENWKFSRNNKEKNCIIRKKVAVNEEIKIKKFMIKKHLFNINNV